MAESRTYDDLIRAAIDFALGKVAAKEPFSLVGLLEAPDGEWLACKLTSKNDEEMFDQARQIVTESQANAFAFLGTGRMGSKNTKPVDVLIAYTKSPEHPHVVRSLAAYELAIEKGQPIFTVEEWEDGEDDYRHLFFG